MEHAARVDVARPPDYDPCPSPSHHPGSVILFQPGLQVLKRKGRLLSARLDQLLPKRGIGLDDDSLPVFAPDSHEDRCRLSAAGDDDSVSLRLVDAFSDLLLKIADRHGFHRMSSVLLSRGLASSPQDWKRMSGSCTALRPHGREPIRERSRTGRRVRSTEESTRPYRVSR